MFLLAQLCWPRKRLYNKIDYIYSFWSDRRVGFHLPIKNHCGRPHVGRMCWRHNRVNPASASSLRPQPCSSLSPNPPIFPPRKSTSCFLVILLQASTSTMEQSKSDLEDPHFETTVLIRTPQIQEDFEQTPSTLVTIKRADQATTLIPERETKRWIELEVCRRSAAYHLECYLRDLKVFKDSECGTSLPSPSLGEHSQLCISSLYL